MARIDARQVRGRADISQPTPGSRSHRHHGAGFIAVGADAAADITGGAVGTAARAVAPAMMVAALIYAIGDVSGAHFNPVVTTAFAMKRLFPPRLVPAYWLAQLIGAVAGALVVRLLLGSAVEAGVSLLAVNFVIHGSTENDPQARRAAQGKDADPSVRA